MEISQTFGATAFSFSFETSSPKVENSKNVFASLLDKQMEAAEKETEDERPNRFADDLAEIKEKGFSAYVRDLEREKIEEIRKEIMARMGLTEEDLAKLSPEQRAMIEDIIAQEIKIRLGASSLEKNDYSESKDQSVETVMAVIRPNFVFVSMPEEPGKNAYLSDHNKQGTGNIFRPDTAGSDGTLPLEAYSLPGWMGDFIPEHVKLDAQIGQSYMASNSARYDNLSSGEKADLAEYMDTLLSFYKKESENRGIETPEDYYNAIVLKGKPELSEEIHQSVQQSLVSESRNRGLMHQFGISL
jgi:hypothetical protein